MFRSRQKILRLLGTVPAVQAPRRSVHHHIGHHIPPLKFDPRIGVPDFISPEAFEVAWTDYMRLLMVKINNYTAGTPFESMKPKELVLRTAREPHHASLFNWVSAAHNNHFFFEGLASEKTTMSAKLEHDIKTSFGSVQTLKDEMTYTARGMFGPGFVWLVRVEKVGQPVAFRVLATYLAGSPYPGAHWRQQAFDMNTASNQAPLDVADEVLQQTRPPPADPQRYLELQAEGSSGNVPRAARHAPGGIDLFPVLCVNTWEHVWLHDYGIFTQDVDGKQHYLECWWDRIDWNRVAELTYVYVGRKF